MRKIDFKIPFSGFAATTFINCFTSAYMYLESTDFQSAKTTFCNMWVNGQCNSCGNCATKPQTLQERYFFLFDTICGRSALRNRFDDTPTPMDTMINYHGIGYDGGAADNIDFLFGFTGYRYHTVTDAAKFKKEITDSICADKPVITRLKDNEVDFAIIVGLDGDQIICPDFKAAQKTPNPAVSYDNIDTLYIIGEKEAPKYSLLDGLKRIANVMDYCLGTDIWGEYMKKIGTYGPDSLGEDKPDGRKARMNRLASTMWYTFNCHNFAEVFRTYLGDKQTAYLYDTVNDVKKLGDPALGELLQAISWRYGYTHDLAWSIIGLDECINWNDWKSHYYGDMLEVIIDKLKENDRAVFECIQKIIEYLS